MKHTIEKVLSILPGVKAPQRRFIAELLLMFSLFCGRATYRNLSRFSDYSEKTFRRWGARPFAFSKFNEHLLASELDTSREYVGVVDCTFVKKAGKHTQGLAKFWHGSENRVEKGIELSVLGIIDLKTHTAYGLEARQTIDSEDSTRTEQYALQITENSESLTRFGVRYIVTDGLYALKKFTDSLRKDGFHQIGKLRVNADLWWPFEGKQSGRGRPKKFSSKAAPVTAEVLEEGWESLGCATDGTHIWSAILYSKSLKSLIRVVVMRRQDTKGKWTQAQLFSTDLEISAHLMYTYYAARFQIEFLIRDAKQHTGLADFQVRSEKRIHNHVNASIAALNVLKLEDRKLQGDDMPSVISIASWKRKTWNQAFLYKVFRKLDIDTTCQKVANVFNELGNWTCLFA